MTNTPNDTTHALPRHLYRVTRTDIGAYTITHYCEGTETPYVSETFNGHDQAAESAYGRACLMSRLTGERIAVQGASAVDPARVEYVTLTQAPAVRYTVVLWLGESGARYYVVDTQAPEAEQPAVVGSFRNPSVATRRAAHL